jgi:hypothetical protein
MKADGKYKELKGNEALTDDDLDSPYEDYRGVKVTLRT